MAGRTAEDIKAEHKVLRTDPHKYIELMSQRIDANPDSASLYLSRHHGWCKLEEWNRALADLNMAIKLKPSLVNLLARGNIRARLGQRALALEDYAAGETISPSEWVDMWGPLFQATSHAYLGHEREALAACGRLKDDHWTPGFDDTPCGNKQEVTEEIRQRLAAAKSNAP